MQALIALESQEVRYAEFVPGQATQYFGIDSNGHLLHATKDTYNLCLTTIDQSIPCLMVRGLSHLIIDAETISCPSPHTVTRYEIHKFESNLHMQTISGYRTTLAVRVLQQDERQTLTWLTDDLIEGHSGGHTENVSSINPTLVGMLPGDTIVVGREPGASGIRVFGPTIAAQHAIFIRTNDGGLSIKGMRRSCDFAVNGYVFNGRRALKPHDGVTIGRNTFFVDERLNLHHDVPFFDPINSVTRVASDPPMPALAAMGLRAAVTGAFRQGLSMRELGAVDSSSEHLATYLPEVSTQPGELLALLTPSIQVPGHPSVNDVAALCVGQSQLTTQRLVQGSSAVGMFPVYGAQHTNRRRLLREVIAYVPQVSAVRPEFTTIENLRSSLTISVPHLGAELADVVTAQVLSLMHLQDLQGSYCDELDILERRCLAISLEILTQPQVLVLEQPFEGLDPDQAATLASILRDYAGQCNASVVYSTHQVSDAERADLVLALQAPSVPGDHSSVAYLGSAAGLRNSVLGIHEDTIMETLRAGGLPSSSAVYHHHIVTSDRRLHRNSGGVLHLAWARQAALQVFASPPSRIRQLNARAISEGRKAWLSPFAWGICQSALWLVIFPIVLGVASVKFVGPWSATSPNGSIELVAGAGPVLFLVGLLALGLYQGSSALLRNLPAVAQTLRWGLGRWSVLVAYGTVCAFGAFIQATIATVTAVTLGGPPTRSPGGSAPFYQNFWLGSLSITLLGGACGLALVCLIKTVHGVLKASLIILLASAFACHFLPLIWALQPDAFWVSCAVCAVGITVLYLLAGQCLGSAARSSTNRKPQS